MITLVLLAGRLAELAQPEDFVGKPVMDRPGGTRSVGRIARAWRSEEGDIMGEVSITDTAYARAIEEIGPVAYWPLESI